MKKLYKFSAIPLLALLFFQCSVIEQHLDPESDYFMTFKVNGELIEYSGSNIGGLARSQNENNAEFLFILLAGSERTSSAFSINFYQISPDIALGNPYHFNYHEEVKNIDEDKVISWAINTTTRNIATMYIDQDGQSFVVAPIGNYNFYQINTYYSLTFTTLNAREVEGTFTGNFCRSDLEGCVTITEGKFRLSNLINA